MAYFSPNHMSPKATMRTASSCVCVSISPCLLWCVTTLSRNRIPGGNRQHGDRGLHQAEHLYARQGRLESLARCPTKRLTHRLWEHPRREVCDYHRPQS
ncbi:hypothetical protein OH77DRAFT_745780 [Trametes cingulata]|nr:hypothetical protein OH77DRAFT_745780 [Trametes cingulata]